MNSVPSRRQFLHRALGTSVAAGVAARAWASETTSALASIAQANDASSSDAAFWATVRGEFMMSADLAYMNNGTLGPIPKPVFAALVDRYRALATDPAAHNTEQFELVEDVRRKAAAFVGAAAEEIALTRNTTEGMSFVANGLDLRAGDEVLLSFHEHPGGLEPWRLKAKRAGIVIKELAFPIPPTSPADLLNRFTDALSSRTRVISVSHMTFQTGSMLPVKQLASLARSKGILTVVDGAHPLGMLRLNLHDLGVDAYASSGHKWLTAPSGTGLLYLRPELQERLWPTVATGGWDTMTSGARRFDRLSQRSWPLLLALGTALDFQTAIGVDRIEARVRELARQVRTGLQPLKTVTLRTPEHPGLHGGLIAFTLGEFRNRDVVNTLRVRDKIGVRYTDYGLNAVRVSTHYYNTEQQIERLLDGLQTIERRGVIGA